MSVLIYPVRFIVLSRRQIDDIVKIYIHFLFAMMVEKKQWYNYVLRATFRNISEYLSDRNDDMVHADTVNVKFLF